MSPGDIVRFKTHLGYPQNHQEEWKLGLLIEYHTWEKIARILYEGNIISIRAENTQLAYRGKEEI